MQRLLASFISLLVLTSVIAVPVHAQTFGDTNTEPLSVSLDPNYPAPYQTVTVTPASTIFDIAASTVTASVNGTSVYKGSGAQPISITVGGPGSVTTISISATNAGRTYTKKLVVRPASVALVVEPVTTTHPFYEGRGLVSTQSRVRVVAVPDIRTSTSAAVSPSSLVYTWKLGNQILESASGIGKNVLDAAAPERYRDADISVMVSTQNQNIVAQAATTISPIDPFVRIYRNDPLIGPIFDIALTGNVAMSDTEDTYRVAPYDFATTPAITWTVNGSESGSDPDITVRASGGGQGTAALGVTVKQNDPLITAASTISILFGQKNSKNIFGF